MPKISVMIPCYNEEENVREIADAVISEIEGKLPKYEYELLFIDNDSQDRTREYLRKMCNDNKNIKAIFNARILANLILLIMGYAEQQAIVQLRCVAIFKILLK